MEQSKDYSSSYAKYFVKHYIGWYTGPKFDVSRTLTEKWHELYPPSCRILKTQNDMLSMAGTFKTLPYIQRE